MRHTAAHRLGALACLLIASLAHADARAEELGREEFRKATKYFEAEEYESALPLYQRAYDLSNRRPSAIRGLAQCERVLKMYDAAIAHFREYLETKPRPSDAKAVKNTIALLEEQAEQQRSTASGSTPATRSSPEPPPEVTRAPVPVANPTLATPPVPAADGDESRGLIASPFFWITVAVVAAGGAVAGIFLARRGPDPAGGAIVDLRR